MKFLARQNRFPNSEFVASEVRRGQFLVTNRVRWVLEELSPYLCLGVGEKWMGIRMRRRKTKLICCLIVLARLGVGLGEFTCRFNVDGLHFDLSQMSFDRPPPYEFYAQSSNGLSAIFYANVCGTVCNGAECKSCADEKDAVAVSVDYQACTSWGVLETEDEWKGLDGEASHGIQTQYNSKGDLNCPNGRSAIYQIKCDPSASTSLLTDVIRSGCSATFEFTSKLACGEPVDTGSSPSSSSSSGGGGEGSSSNDGSSTETKSKRGGHSFFLMFFLMGMLIYCSIGICLNVREGREGVEAIPHAQFWGALPRMALEAASNLFNIVSSAMGNSRSSYQTFSSSRENGGAPNVSIPPPSGVSSASSTSSIASSNAAAGSKQPQGPNGEFTVI